MPAFRRLRAISFTYLLTPVVLFALGWIRAPIGLAITLVIAWTLWKLWRAEPEPEAAPRLREVAIVAAVSGLWVVLSGVGAYAFQNWDHHWRNAVLHDLIDYSWPVIYSAPEKGPIKMLVYNVGHWLPAAIGGRYLGWGAANALLFLWTWLGVGLVGLQLLRRFRHWSGLLLLIGFSGLDALGTAVFTGEPYPMLWPPITHLEIWSGDLQYSSFTTQLFWVFHQAVPAWLCIALLTVDRAGRDAPLLWSLCLFYAPLPAVGWAPFIIIALGLALLSGTSRLGDRLRGLFPASTPAAIVISGIMAVYYLSNTAGREWALAQPDARAWLVFVVLEVGLLWLLLLAERRADWRLYVAGALLLIIPFVRIGSGRDFVMRASIPALFYLMIRSGDVLFWRRGVSDLPVPFEGSTAASPSPGRPAQPGRPGLTAGGAWRRTALIGLLALGALTPLYEINRSIYRTLQYYFVPSTRAASLETRIEHLTPDVMPEAEHPGRLEADGLQTLGGLRDEISRNFIGDVRRSLFYTYLSDR